MDASAVSSCRRSRPQPWWHRYTAVGNCRVARQHHVEFGPTRNRRGLRRNQTATDLVSAIRLVPAPPRTRNRADSAKHMAAFDAEPIIRARLRSEETFDT